MTTTPVETEKFSLRDYQIDVRSQVYDYFRSGITSVLIYAPTGAGKTAIASKFIADAVSKGRRVLFCVHRVRLLKQTQKTLLYHFGIDAGIIWADCPKDYDKCVQIAMLQTLQHRELPPDIGLVIVDEAHTTAYYKICRKMFDTYSNGILALSKCYFVGLSASPWRSKTTEGFCQFFSAVARAPYPQKLIEYGYLCRSRQFGYNGLIDYSKLDVSSEGDYTQKSMQSVCTPQLNSDIVVKYLELCSQRKAIAFCASVNQARDLAAKFSLEGIACACIVQDTSENDRVEIFDKYASGEIQIITSVGVLCEGFDEPSVDAVILARPTKSRALLVQMCGRGLRLNEGKEDCWIVDFCENISRLGFPTNQYPTPLCPPIKRIVESEDWSKECPSCHAIIPKVSRLCPNCGHAFPSVGGLDIKPEGLPPFGEILTPEQKRQAKYYRKLISSAFEERKSRLAVEEIFNKKYKFLPPPEWAVHAIFNNESKLINYNKQIYLRYLLKHSPSSDKTITSWMFDMMEREFSRGFDFSLKSCWEIFQIEKPFPTKELLDIEYMFKLQQWQHLNYSHDRLALLNLAYDEGLEYYVNVTQKAKEKILMLYSTQDKPKALAAIYLTASSTDKKQIDNSISTELKEKIDHAIAHHWDSVPVS